MAESGGIGMMNSMEIITSISFFLLAPFFSSAMLTQPAEQGLPCPCNVFVGGGSIPHTGGWTTRYTSEGASYSFNTGCAGVTWLTFSWSGSSGYCDPGEDVKGEPRCDTVEGKKCFISVSYSITLEGGGSTAGTIKADAPCGSEMSGEMSARIPCPDTPGTNLAVITGWCSACQ
ncbi:MAG: hypothetical protein ACI87O_002627 [Planctomycetota bacterium]